MIYCYIYKHGRTYAYTHTVLGLELDIRIVQIKTDYNSLMTSYCFLMCFVAFRANAQMGVFADVMDRHMLLVQ